MAGQHHVSPPPSRCPVFRPGRTNPHRLRPRFPFRNLPYNLAITTLSRTT